MATRRSGSVGVGAALSYLYATLTQGGADAFVQATIATPLTNATEELCLLVREILIELPNVNPVSGGRFELTLTRKSQTAIPTLTSTYQSLITKLSRAVGVTTSGGIVWDPLPLIQYDTESGPRIVEQNIYAQFDSAATGGTNTAYVRIGYTLESISAVDRNAILVATATATA